MKKVLIFLFFVLLTSFASADLSDGMIRCLSFDNDDTSGSTVIDLSNTQNATLTGLTTNQTGKFGESYYWDGTNNKNVIVNGLYMNSLPEYTIIAYIKRQVVAGSSSVFRDYSGTVQSIVTTYGATGIIGYNHYDATSAYSATPTSHTYSSTAFEMTTVVMDSNTEFQAHYYENATMDGNNTVAKGIPKTTGTQLYIGDVPNFATDSWKGWIDNVMIWNRSLNETEISKVYNLSCSEILTLITSISNFSISALNIWDNASISNFSVEINNNGTIYNTTTGTLTTDILENSTSLWNITVFADDWFNNTYLNYNVSSNLDATLKQSWINFSARNTITNETFSNYHVKLNGTIACNTTGTNCGISYPNAGTNYIAELIDNDDTFKNSNTTINITALDNTTIYLYATQYIANITAKNLLDNTTINNFSLTVTHIEDNDTFTYNTTNGFIEVPTSNGNFNFTIDAPGYSTNNNSIIFNVTSDINHTFYLYTTNSLNITFKDADTNSLLTNKTITIQFIGTTAQTNTTNTSTLYVDLLSPDDYTLLYDSPGYRQGKYIISVTNRSYQSLTLYLRNETGTQLILVTVNDRFGNPVEGAQVTVQRWANDAWKTEQIIQTDFQGRTEAYYVLSTVFYNHVINLNGINYFGAINEDDDKKLIYAEDVASGLSFTINILGENEYVTYQETYDVSTSLTFTNTSNITGRFRYSWDDEANIDVTARLLVRKANDQTIICDETTTSESGITFCTFNNTGTPIVYTAQGFIDGTQKEAYTVRFGVEDSGTPNWAGTGYLFTFIILILLIFAFISVPDLALWISFIGIGILTYIGVIFKGDGTGNLSVISVIGILTYLVFRIKSDAGVNA